MMRATVAAATAILLALTAAIVVLLVSVLDQSDAPELPNRSQAELVAEKERARSQQQHDSFGDDFEQFIEGLPAPSGVDTPGLFWTGIMLTAAATGFLGLSLAATLRRSTRGLSAFPSWESATIVTSAQLVSSIAVLAGAFAITAAFSDTWGA